LRQLYIDELKDLYNAETQLVKALPKMAKASSNTQLRQGFEEHLRQTSEHVSAASITASLYFSCIVSAPSFTRPSIPMHFLPVGFSSSVSKICSS
jgi:hypothetical protein